jgi:hypothetical protein
VYTSDYGGGDSLNVFERNSFSFSILFVHTLVVAAVRDGKFAEEIEVYSFLTTSTVDSALWHFLHS